MANSRISLEYSDKSVRAKITKVKNALTLRAQQSVIRRAADVWHGRLVRRTPRRWTGQTAKSWRVVTLPSGEAEVTNPSQAMLWLERGTRAHGPKKAKRLFVPLTKRAAQAGPRGVISANKAAANKAAWANYGIQVTKGKKKKAKLPFIYGVDYVWAKRVKGIKAMWIVRSARVQARASYKVMMSIYIRSILQS